MTCEYEERLNVNMYGIDIKLPFIPSLLFPHTTCHWGDVKEMCQNNKLNIYSFLLPILRLCLSYSYVGNFIHFMWIRVYKADALGFIAHFAFHTFSPSCCLSHFSLFSIKKSCVYYLLRHTNVKRKERKNRSQ